MPRRRRGARGAITPFRDRKTAGVTKEVAQRLGGWRADISEKVYNHDMQALAEAIHRLA